RASAASVSRTGSAAPYRKSKWARQGSRPDEAGRRTGDALRVHLSLLVRRLRLSLRDQVERDEGVKRWIGIHELVSTKENTDVHEISLRSGLRRALRQRSFSRRLIYGTDDY